MKTISRQKLLETAVRAAERKGYVVEFIHSSNINQKLANLDKILHNKKVKIDQTYKIKHYSWHSIYGEYFLKIEGKPMNLIDSVGFLVKINIDIYDSVTFVLSSYIDRQLIHSIKSKKFKRFFREIPEKKIALFLMHWLSTDHKVKEFIQHERVH